MIALGTGMDMVVYSLWLFHLTRSPLFVSFALLVISSSPMVWGHVIARFIDRSRPFALVFVAYMMFAVGSLIPSFIDAYNAWLWPALVIGMMLSGFGYSIIGAVWPVLTRRTLDPEQFARADGVLGMVSNAKLFVGPTLGGILFYSIGPHNTFRLEAFLSFAAAALAVYLLRRFPLRSSDGADIGFKTPNDRDRHSAREWLSRNPVLRLSLVIAILSAVGFGIVNALWTPLLVVRYHANSLIIGGTYLAQSVGGLGGNTMVLHRWGRAPQLRRIKWLYLILTATTAIYTLTASNYFLFPVLIIEGIAIEVFQLPLRLVWMSVPPDQLVGKITSYRLAITSGISAGTTLLAGWLAQRVGLQWVFLGVATTFLSAALISFKYHSPAMKTWDEQLSLVGSDV
ncbi:MFS transporter [Sulfobacillus sp. hq2]|uniref:MFS transporter n=1 Tax=Sulfobacillus sp. hq2 TaxID=2039167 RepID=UPI001304AB01|nr:MFS transporter [Sulfobacillus sp. hq2]